MDKFQINFETATPAQWKEFRDWFAKNGDLSIYGKMRLMYTPLRVFAANIKKGLSQEAPGYQNRGGCCCGEEDLKSKEAAYYCRGVEVSLGSTLLLKGARISGMLTEFPNLPDTEQEVNGFGGAIFHPVKDKKAESILYSTECLGYLEAEDADSTALTLAQRVSYLKMPVETGVGGKTHDIDFFKEKLIVALEAAGISGTMGLDVDDNVKRVRSELDIKFTVAGEGGAVYNHQIVSFDILYPGTMTDADLLAEKTKITAAVKSIGVMSLGDEDKSGTTVVNYIRVSVDLFVAVAFTSSVGDAHAGRYLLRTAPSDKKGNWLNKQSATTA